MDCAKNLCTVITDGTAVLGDIGPEAGMPAVAGKCALFKAFADVACRTGVAGSDSLPWKQSPIFNNRKETSK